LVQYLAILAVIFAFGKTAYALTESEFSSALSKAKLDIAVMTIVQSCKSDVDNDFTSLACKCALTYADYENEMAHQIQFQRCLDGKATAEPTDTEKLTQLLEVFKYVFGDKNRPGVTEGETALIGPRSDTKPISQNEIEQLRSHIARCWDPPIGSVGEDNLIVDIVVELDPEGKVIRAVVDNKLRFNTDRIFKVAAEEAVRALRECSPLPLPPEKYESWKKFIFTFDPRFLE